MTREVPRSDKWAEWYIFRPNVLATWGEANGYGPKHESFCENDPAPMPGANHRAPCWCSAFCGFCDHHMDRHTYGQDEHVPCEQCPGGLCPREPRMSHRGR